LFACRQPQKLPAPFRGESVPACNARFICLRDSDIHVDRFVRFHRTHGRRWQCRRARFHRILMFFSRPQAPISVYSRVGIRTAIQCVVLCVQCVVLPFCRAHQCMYCYRETPNGPQTCKSVSPMAGSGPPINIWFLGRPKLQSSCRSVEAFRQDTRVGRRRWQCRRARAARDVTPSTAAFASTSASSTSTPPNHP